jgi:hypothetical protein
MTVHSAPQFCYAEHAVIKGWRDKAHQKHVASILVKHASPITRMTKSP